MTLTLTILLLVPVGLVVSQCNSDSDAIPLYRAYKGGSGKSPDHFYTTDYAELQAAVKNDGYKYEGVAGRILSLATCFGAPGFLRLYHGPLNDHFYTASASEATQFISLGYKEEGFIGCVSKYKCPGMAPLYRAYHDGAGDHFCTMSAAEKDAAVNKDGYKDEGIAAWIFPA